jgi:homoserine dehydrogenase
MRIVMSTVVEAVRAKARVRTGPRSAAVRIALLGVGHVGGAVAALLRTNPLAGRFTITSGLVRDITRSRPNAAHVSLTCDPAAALHGDPDLVIEVLGGLEPARTLVMNAIERRIPVVTANKSLLAAHGGELLAAAARYGVPFRYEAAVLAGVPFLGTFDRRPLARAITGASGIVNGTTNFILSKMSVEGTRFNAALHEAQQCGYAEPDPSNDINGTDAAEKLCVLMRHFCGSSVFPAQLERVGIETISPEDLRAARELGGALKPVVHAQWNAGECSAFTGPAFVPNSHPLSRIDGVQNAVLLRNASRGNLLFAGPGAGPDVTAATLLDDAIEIVEECRPAQPAIETTRSMFVKPAETGWFVRIPHALDERDRLSLFGIAVQRAVVEAGQSVVLTHSCEREQFSSALRELERRAGCAVSAFRVLCEN